MNAFNSASFNVNKWTTSFVATLASQIVLFCRVAGASQTAHYRVRLLGKNIHERDDPPIGSAAPAMGVCLSQTLNDGVYQAVLQRGGDGKRKSLIEVAVTKTAGELIAIHVGGYAVQAGSGVIDVD